MIYLFFVAIYEFILILNYEFSDIKKHQHSAYCAVVIIMIIVFLVFCNTSLYTSVPTYIAIIISAVSTVHLLFESVYCYKYKKNHLSKYAVKEAIDDLTTGVCFANKSGVILLCNKKMGSLSSDLIGSYPQTIDELINALNGDNKSLKVSKIPDNLNLYRFPDNSVWKFSIFELSDGFKQITAQNVTDIYELSEKLRTKNNELKKVNDKLNEMYARIAEHIHEQEILNLKMRIHDNIGASLIAISDMITDDEQGDFDTQIEILHNSISTLSGGIPNVSSTFDEVKQKAAKMKVEIALIGTIPQDTMIQTLISSALRVCVTNCVVHAKGNKVTVNISEHLNIVHVTITNNGDVPKGKIVEGSGLSNLRKSVETTGGEMFISHYPVFALILNLPVKEQ